MEKEGCEREMEVKRFQLKRKREVGELMERAKAYWGFYP